MRKPVLLIFANAMILIVVFMLMAQSLFVVQRIAQAGEVKGLVEVRRGSGEFQALKSGGVVAVGDVVRTGDKSGVEFTWADKTRWKLASNTQLTVKKASVNKKIETSQFRLDAGQVFVRLVKKLAPASRFEIETPTAVAAVRGTVFSVAVEGGQTKVEVFKGHVQVSAQNGAEKMVDPGHQGTTGAGAIQIADAKGDAFLAQPELIRPDMELEIRPLKGDTALLRGATEVGNTLFVDEKPAKVLATGAFLKRVKLQAGHNQWTVVAKDKHDETTSECRALEFDATTQKTTETKCK